MQGYLVAIGAGGTKGVYVDGYSSYANGNPGGTTSITALNLSASGGAGGYYACHGGSGGSGGGGGRMEGAVPGNGGSDGSDGEGTAHGTGQHTTTRAFEEPDGALFSPGGAGNGGYSFPGPYVNGAGLTGDNSGAGGSSYVTQDGCSGIVLIRSNYLLQATI